LPKYLAERLKGLAPDDREGVEKALSEAHVFTDQKLHVCRNINDSMAGTTSISVLLRGRTMYVSNVGDSRAILISSHHDGTYVTTPLSRDQTPYRRDERERVKKYGAKIMTMDQVDGVEPKHENWDDLILGEKIDETGDPPRIWAPNGNYPGTAFTRSIGDRLAKALGVIAKPEILIR
jgi:hypothetical protein